MGTVEGNGKPVHRIVHPFAPNLFADVNDVDQLAFLYCLIRDQRQALQQAEAELRFAIADHSRAETKTGHIKTDHYTVKVEQPDDAWSQAMLKQVWSSWDDANTYLRIGSLAPNLREVKKLENTSGDETFEAWKKVLLDARQPSGAAPKITVKEN